ncbi:MAG: Ig-like domain-containing protein [Planctomycetia bacterium]|nr:Ig-like domain-containing protein [Planctomycetia bacterium]
MKRIKDVGAGISLSIAVLFLILIMHVMTTNADTFQIFRPGPGLNDGTDDGSINAGKDTFFYRCEEEKYYGADYDIIGRPRSTCNPCNDKGYIQFNISTLPDNVARVYLGVTHFSHTDHCYSNCIADFYFYPVLEPWGEISLPSFPPSEGAAVYGPINIAFPNNFGNKEYNITEVYRQWKSGSIPNNGLVIYSPDGDCNNAATQFSIGSSDNPDVTMRPYLKVIPVGADPTPPTVTSTNPANNATKININSSITATFSESMDATTITTNTFILNNGSTNIDGTVSYSGTTATFTPSSPLVVSTTYTAMITTGVTDEAGNTITSDYTWGFTTPFIVPYVSPKIIVDGNVSESAWDIATDVNKTVIGTTNNNTKFGVLWDTTYLYVGMKVLDDTLYNDSAYVHEDDSVEIYIDGDHNHGTTYDSYDRQFIKGWFDSALFEQHGKSTGVTRLAAHFWWV